MNNSLLKSILHNIGVLCVGFAVGCMGLAIDILLNIPRFYTGFLTIVAVLFLAIGFLLRVWATYYFYQHQMKVIVLEPQNTLITTGPYHFSRNPLYLGGNIFIFFGASFLLGSLSSCIITILGIYATDRMIKREEKQLEKRFGEQWINYKKQVRRWF